MATLQLRPGAPGDAPAVARLVASFQRELTDHPDGVGAEAYLESVSEAAERTYLGSDRCRYWLAFDDGGAGPALLGFIALRDNAHLFHLFVAREQQRRGLARQLWQRASDEALQRGNPGRFTVNASLAAVPVYRAFGFVESAPVVRAHGMSFWPMRLGEPAGDAQRDAVVLDYAAIWSEPDEARRQVLIEASLTADAVILGPGYRFDGHAAIAAEATRFALHNRGYRAVMTSGIDTHHDTARFGIAMLAADGSVAQPGEDIVFFAADGRIRQVLTYWGPLPPLTVR